MAAHTKGRSKLRIEFVVNRNASVLGGLPAIEGLCDQFGLWQKLRAIPGLDRRRRKSQGYAAELIVAQLLYCLCSGGDSLADAERLNEDALAKLVARADGFADQTTLGEWLRGQSAETVTAMWEVVREFVRWVIGRAQPQRWQYLGRAEVFFDDTQLEVNGRSFEGAARNYNGDLALSWQTMWYGPFLVDGQLGSPGDVSAALPAMLTRNRPLWQSQAAEFLADSGSSAGPYLEAIGGAGFERWSVSYNKWVGPLERLAASLPEAVWSQPQAARWRDGSPIQEQHALLRHQPEGSAVPQSFAAVRFKQSGEMFWRYRFVAYEGTRLEARAVFARHRLKGEKEQLLKEVLRSLDLHHPPCAELMANQMFYAVAALAYNVLIALKLLHLPDDCQGWQVKTMLKKLMLLPASVIRHARLLVARIQVPAQWLQWWSLTMARLWTLTNPGRPSG